MVGVGLDIKGNGYDFNFSKITGDDCHVQNVSVILGTQLGSDKVFPAKGTNLTLFFIGKNYISGTRTQHLANFASLSAKQFYQQFNSPVFRLEDITVDASSLFLNSPNLKVNVIIAENPGNYRN